MDLVRILLAFFLPPVSVFMEVGLKAPFWINILLTLFGYLPGVIHAVYVIVKKNHKSVQSQYDSTDSDF